MFVYVKDTPGDLISGGGGAGYSLIWALYRYVQPQRIWFQPIWSEIRCRFWSEIGYAFSTLILNWVCFIKMRLLFHLYR